MPLVVICDPEPSPSEGTFETKLCRLLGQTTGGSFTFATHFCCNANCPSLTIRHMQNNVVSWFFFFWFFLFGVWDKFSVSLLLMGDRDDSRGAENDLVI